MHCIKAGENRQFESYTVASCQAEDLVQHPPGDHCRNTLILSPWGKLKGTDQKKNVFRNAQVQLKLNCTGWHRFLKPVHSHKQKIAQ